MPGQATRAVVGGECPPECAWEGEWGCRQEFEREGGGGTSSTSAHIVHLHISHALPQSFFAMPCLVMGDSSHTYLSHFCSHSVYSNLHIELYSGLTRVRTGHI